MQNRRGSLSTFVSGALFGCGMPDARCAGDNNELEAGVVEK